MVNLLARLSLFDLILSSAPVVNLLNSVDLIAIIDDQEAVVPEASVVFDTTETTKGSG